MRVEGEFTGDDVVNRVGVGRDCLCVRLVPRHGRPMPRCPMQHNT